MGALAVDILLQQLGPSETKGPPVVAVEPELIVRESTGPLRQKTTQVRRKNV
jgi:DNA-binding LacI/PurR family transcriptional regulator